MFGSVDKERAKSDVNYRKRLMNNSDVASFWSGNAILALVAYTAWKYPGFHEEYIVGLLGVLAFIVFTSVVISNSLLKPFSALPGMARMYLSGLKISVKYFFGNRT